MTTLEHSTAQQDEVDSMSAIFMDEFSLLSDGDPVFYSILLRAEYEDDTARESSSLLPADLALTIKYTPNYPDTLPIFGVGYTRTHASLHPIQERAIVKIAEDTAQTELGMPSIYQAVHAVKAFLEQGGLAQAGIALLSDDCLAHILQYLVTKKDDIDDVLLALPIFEQPAKMNVVWKQLCQCRWKDKWGYKQRWKNALEHSQQQHYNEAYWIEAYNKEEEDSSGRSLTCDELSALTFDMRQWFDFNLFRNQPDNMRDVLPSGLKNSLARDVVFASTGDIISERRSLRTYIWKSFRDAADIVQIRLPRMNSSIENFTFHRLENWGWELRGSDYVCRAVDDDGDIDKLWTDFTSCIVVQDKPEWVESHRAPYPYNYREVPNDEDLKMMLDW